MTDGDGKRYSLDGKADRSYDAAHLYLTHERGNPGCGFSIPTTSMQFEAVTGGRIHQVQAKSPPELVLPAIAYAPTIDACQFSEGRLAESITK